MFGVLDGETVLQGVQHVWNPKTLPQKLSDFEITLIEVKSLTHPPSASVTAGAVLVESTVRLREGLELLQHPLPHLVQGLEALEAVEPGNGAQATAGTRTIDTSRKATVAYPTVKRLLFHKFYATHPRKLLKSHGMV